MLLNKKKEERDHEIDQYHNEKGSPDSKDRTEEEAKNDRIKKGLAALNMAGGGQNPNDIQEKRRNFMGQIRDALIAGDGESEGFKKKVKKQAPKKKDTELL